MWSRRGRVRLSFISAVLATILIGAGSALADSSPAGGQGDPQSSVLSADLDGHPINLVDVSKYYCHDFAYPRIHCFSRASDLTAAVAPTVAAGSVTYVVVFDYTSWQGPYMYFSQDYTVLATIGWNDRISSYIGQNNQSGRFWTDWFFTGTSYTFCCNMSAASLGSFDNTFSSVYQV